MTNYDLYFEWLWEKRDDLIDQEHHTQRLALLTAYPSLDIKTADAIVRVWHKEARTYD
jgi:hypothetical protein